MQKKTEGICFAISAGICWGSMGVAAQVLMEDSGFTVGDLVPSILSRGEFRLRAVKYPLHPGQMPQTKRVCVYSEISPTKL